jgi:putative membrane protein
MNIFIRWIIFAAAILITAYILPGVSVDGIVAALVVAVILGAINAVLKPILIILTLPINILTLGLFTFVINALLVLLASSIVPGFYVDGFWWALLFAIVLSIINSFFHSFAKRDRAVTS